MDDEQKLEYKSRILTTTESKDVLNYIHKNNALGLGTYTGFKHSIVLQKEPSVKVKSYSTPFLLRNAAKKHIEDLLAKIIIRKSSSYYCSPSFFIPKKNGNLRLVIDYKSLNSVTKKETFACPNLEECLVDLQKSSVYSSIDLNLGYHQILMEENSIKYTAFSALNTHYEYLRLPFGLTNAPRSFQRAMQEVLGDLDFVKIYLDDVLVYSNTYNDHLNHVKEVCSRLNTAGLTINVDKSKFFQKEVEYLGHIINKDGYTPNLSKVDKNAKIELPNTKRKLQKLIGMLNWFRPFIRGISSKMIFLTGKLGTQFTSTIFKNFL